MRVLLISGNPEKGPTPVMPLGLAYIASSIEEEGHDALIHDPFYNHTNTEKVIENYNPDIIGISIRNIDNNQMGSLKFYLPVIKRLVDTCKRYYTPIVVGGPGFSIFPEATLKYLDVDFGIVGEGEISFKELLNSLEKKNNIKDIPGLLIKNNEKIIFNKPCHIKILDELPFPGRYLINTQDYTYNGEIIGNIQTKRGCYFQCIYCTYPKLEGHKIRLRSPKLVVDEIEEMCELLNIRSFYIVDSVFNNPLSHAIEICKEIKERKLDISWKCYLKPDMVSDTLIKSMKEGGCSEVVFGTDSGSKEVLTALKKSITISSISRASELCKENRLKFSHSLLFGGPGETIKTAEKTLSFIKKLNPDGVSAIAGIRIYPDTYLEKIAKKEKVIKPDEDLLYPKFYTSSAVNSTTLHDFVTNSITMFPERKDSFSLSLKVHEGKIW